MTESSRLSRATDALRESTSLNDRAHNTRARILTTVRDKRVRRQRVLGALVVFACVSVGSTAWAAVTGYLPRALRAIGLPVRVDSAEPSSVESSENARRRPRFKRVHEVPVAEPPTNAMPEGIEPVEAIAPPAATAPRPNVSERPRPIVEPPTPVDAPTAVEQPLPSASRSRPDRADVIYELAHQAHFATHNFEEALPLWDAYLRDAPNGRFVPEAEYNRALCLVRLGRRADATVALERIASRANGYRAREAQQILDALRPATP